MFRLTRGPVDGIIITPVHMINVPFEIIANPCLGAGLFVLGAALRRSTREK
jgi:hypothetical protein